MHYTTLEQLKTWRRHLHQYPELSLQEFETARYIRQQLDAMNLPYITAMNTATIVILNGKRKESLLFRADIDALPIHEQNDIPFRSKHDSVMHACGHDGHITMLLGALNELRYLQQSDELDYSIVAVFQPSEESNGGANLLVDAYNFNQHHIQAAFALHVNPDYHEGQFISRIGELMASCNEFKITITGQSAHVGLRHRGINAMHAATQIFQQCQSLPSYTLNDQHVNIVHIGVLRAGEAMNIVPENALLEGTIRTYDMNDLATIKQKIEDICQGIAIATGCTVDLHFEMGYPAIINNAELMPLVKEAAITTQATFAYQKDPYLLGEDFSFFQQIAPINYSFIGIRNELLGYTNNLHTPTLQLREEALAYGVDYFVALAKYAPAFINTGH